MKSWYVDTMIDEHIIEAERFEILPNGNVAFYESNESSVMVAAFAAWVSVVEVEEDFDEDYDDDMDLDDLELGLRLEPHVNPVLTIVYGDEWAGLYIDGKIATQGHSVLISDFVKHAKDIGPFDFETRFVDDAWLADRGRLPEDLSAVVLEAE